MGYSKAKEKTKDYLIGASLPTYSDTYTVISHKYVIDTTKQMIASSGFIVEKEIYIANQNARVAQGIYYIRPVRSIDEEINNETELGMMFAWTNSYDKSTKFQCAVGARVIVCGNGMLCGEINFARKHTGTADLEVRSQISNQLKKAELTFKNVLADRNILKSATLPIKRQGELLGRMFLHDMIGPRQMQIVKNEIEKPSFDYNADKQNAWAFYNYVTHAFKTTHPRDWLSDTKQFHDFMSAEILNNMGIKNHDNTSSLSATPEIDSEEDSKNIIIDNIPADEVDLQDLEDVQHEHDQAKNEESNTIECSTPEGKEFDTSYDLPSEEADPQVTILPGTVTTLEETMEAIEAENSANEEADMIKNEEIIEERDEGPHLLDDQDFNFEI